MGFRVHDRVVHSHYPDRVGSIVALYGALVIVLWDEGREPPTGCKYNLPQRMSKHIPGALEHVQV